MEPQEKTTEALEVTAGRSSIVLPKGVKPKRKRAKKEGKAAVVPQVILPYRKNARWHGRTMYECSSCAFSTLNEEAMLAHVNECKRMGGQ